MKKEVFDALKDSGLSEARCRPIRERFAVGPRPFVQEELTALAAAVKAAQAEQAAVAVDPKTILRERLDGCFFGTIAERDQKEGTGRKKRLADGWRSGKSKPIQLVVGVGFMRPEEHPERLDRLMVLRLAGAKGPGPATFDVIEDTTWTVKMYELLKLGIAAGEITAP